MSTKSGSTQGGWERQHSRNTIVLTTIAAASAIGSMIFSGLQWHEIHEGGTQVARQIAIAEKQSNAAVMQAEAGKRIIGLNEAQVKSIGRQVTIAQRALAIQAASNNASQALVKQVQQEAQAKGRTIQLAFLNLPSDVIANQRATFTEVLNNVGATPIVVNAYYTGIRLGSESPDAAYIAYLNDLRKVEPQRKTIGPGMTLNPNFDMGLIFSQTMADAFQAHQTRLIFMSYLPYRDASGVLHHTHLCAFVEKGSAPQACNTPLDD